MWLESVSPANVHVCASGRLAAGVQAMHHRLWATGLGLQALAITPAGVQAWQVPGVRGPACSQMSLPWCGCRHLVSGVNCTSPQACGPCMQPPASSPRPPPPPPPPLPSTPSPNAKLSRRACRYRKYKVSEDVQLVVRCEVDGVMTHKGQDEFLSIKALNEYDPKITGEQGTLGLASGQALLPPGARKCDLPQHHRGTASHKPVLPQHLRSLCLCLLADEWKSINLIQKMLARRVCCQCWAGAGTLRLPAGMHLLTGGRELAPHGLASQVQAGCSSWQTCTQQTAGSCQPMHCGRQPCAGHESQAEPCKVLRHPSLTCM